MPMTDQYFDDGHPLHTIDIYSPTQTGLWVIFIHGGAWRDVKQDSHNGDPLLLHLLDEDLPINLASLNYRLSPEIVHPGHQEDVIAALNYLKDHYGMKQYVLVGHSAGACLAFQVGYVVLGCQGIVSVEGIYDLGQLVLEYPLYRGFLEEAFGKEGKAWTDASPTTIAAKCHKGSSVKIQLVQSREDELLSPRQTETMLSVLKDNANNIPDIAWVTGSHDESITLPDFFVVVHTFVRQILMAVDRIKADRT